MIIQWVKKKKNSSFLFASVQKFLLKSLAGRIIFCRQLTHPYCIYKEIKINLYRPISSFIKNFASIVCLISFYFAMFLYASNFTGWDPLKIPYKCAPLTPVFVCEALKNINIQNILYDLTRNKRTQKRIFRYRV